jgi:hypothetical protein
MEPKIIKDVETRVKKSLENLENQKILSKKIK